jgi:hypothetical protein
MRKLILLSVILAMVIVISSCEKNDEIIQISLLEKSWIQSYEEKTSEEIEIFRPSNFKEFPLSRYRQFFNFDNNNVCHYSKLAPNDGHFMENGRWKYMDKTNIIKVFNSNYEMLFAFEVIELTDNLLKLKALNEF